MTQIEQICTDYNMSTPIIMINENGTQMTQIEQIYTDYKMGHRLYGDKMRHR